MKKEKGSSRRQVLECRVVVAQGRLLPWEAVVAQGNNRAALKYF
jgi:hypothetical protein